MKRGAKIDLRLTVHQAAALASVARKVAKPPYVLARALKRLDEAMAEKGSRQ